MVRKVWVAAIALAVAVGISGCSGGTGPVPGNPSTQYTVDSAFEQRPFIGVVGDTFAAGTTQNTPNVTWPRIVAKKRGYDLNCYCQQGSGYIPEPKTQAGTGRKIAYSEQTADADNLAGAQRIILSGGYDDRKLSSSDFDTAVKQSIRNIKAVAKGVPITVLSVFWPPQGAAIPAKIALMNLAIRNNAAALGAQYVDVSNLLLGHPEWVGPDETYPNDAGQTAIAEFVLRQVSIPVSTS